LSNPDTSPAANPVSPQPLADFQGQLDPDPDHHFPAVDLQIFGGDTSPTRVPNMQGFVKSYFNQRRDLKHSEKIGLEVSHSRNRNGSIGVRLLLSESMNSASAAVPFYFQQTLGGSDINGAMSLGSYRDYRYRAPNLWLLQESFEHSLWGPLGVKFLADQGRVALTRGDVGFDHLKHSFAAGFTLRAGGFPMVSLMFAWGGSEGHHNIFNMNTSLLGGSARPLLD
jgi:hypothetical protein